MSASLVGSEMCIRDRTPVAALAGWLACSLVGVRCYGPPCCEWRPHVPGACLLYTSDAADDM
eukprot:12608826-Alexandrium_andersonii.AAC.1